MGPVEARLGDRPVAVGGGRQLTLLAFLLLHPNRAVSSDALIDAVWGPERDGSVKRLQMAVARLRKALKPLDTPDGSPLQTVSGGYLLSIAADELDAGVFAELVNAGRRALEGGDPTNASEVLTQALALWRGPPLAEVSYEEFAQAEIRRLEELRRLALEARADAHLQLGQHAAVVAELEALLVEEPARERIAALLILALYRSGRQGDALEVYQRTRAHLNRELGLEPGPELTALQTAILGRDQALMHHAPGGNGDAIGGHAAREPDRAATIPGAGRLPVPATPFLGRGRELILATQLLRETRVLTLTGAGGSGKTRLALRLAETCGCDYSGGALFAGFAEVTDPDLIVPTISQTLGLGETPNQTPLARVQEWLGQRELLLVLDNLEQLTRGTAVLGELLSACPGLSMIVTSREPLHLSGEQQYEVPLLEPEDAIQLFVARARAVAPEASADREILDAICERLDRLPLAIELAAARTKMLSPAEILQRLEHRLALATAGPRDAPRRQRTLRATIDWSFDLLTAEQRELFARLSVFAGGWTLAAAEAVCAAELDTLGALVDRSLVKSDGKRYWMLQTLREFALEKLTRSGEEDELRHRHIRWFVELLHAHRESERSVAVRAGTLRVQLGAERENFRAALDWAQHAGEIETVARLALPLSQLWLEEGRLSEIARWLEIAEERVGEFSLPLQAGVLDVRRQLARDRGEYARAAELARRSLPLQQELGNVNGVFWAMLSQAGMSGCLGEVDQSHALFEQAIHFAREHVPHLVPDALIDLADQAIAENRLDEARAHCEEALRLGPTEEGTVVAGLINLAHVDNRKRRFQDAAEFAREAVARSLSAEYPAMAAAAGFELAWSLAGRLEPQRTARLLGAAAEVLRRTGVNGQRTDKVSENAVRDILSARHLDVFGVEGLIEEGRAIPLHQAVQEALNDLGQFCP